MLQKIIEGVSREKDEDIFQFVDKYVDDISWADLCTNMGGSISTGFLDRYRSHIRWEWLTLSAVPLPSDILARYWDALPTDLVIANQVLPEWLIRAKLSNKEDRDYMLYMGSISSFQKLSDGFIRDFGCYLNWYSLSQKQTLSIAILREFSAKIYWDEVSACQTLSQSMMHEFADKLDWDKIAKYQKLNADTINLFSSHLPYSVLKTREDIPSVWLKEVYGF